MCTHYICIFMKLLGWRERTADDNYKNGLKISPLTETKCLGHFPKTAQQLTSAKEGGGGEGGYKYS